MTDASQLPLSSSPYADQLQAAIQAAQQAGELIRSNFDRSLTITTKKDYNELVTDLDIRSEQTILESLAQHFGDYSILSEEKGKIDRPGRRQWVIDPLDGTHNLTLGLPVLGVSIARGRFAWLPGGKPAATLLVAGFMTAVGAVLLAGFERRTVLLQAIPFVMLAGCFWLTGGLRIGAAGPAILVAASLGGYGVMATAFVSNVRASAAAARQELAR